MIICHLTSIAIFCLSCKKRLGLSDLNIILHAAISASLTKRLNFHLRKQFKNGILNTTWFEIRPISWKTFAPFVSQPEGSRVLLGKLGSSVTNSNCPKLDPFFSLVNFDHANIMWNISGADGDDGGGRWLLHTLYIHTIDIDALHVA